jgi:hypothetical protein
MATTINATPAKVWAFDTKKTKNGFEAMNLKLKELSEKSA